MPYGFSSAQPASATVVAAGTGIAVTFADPTYTVSFDATSSPTLAGLTLSGLGAGFVRSSAGGVLSSSPLVAGDIPDLSATYLTVSSASSTYLTIANASATYLTIANASATYLTIANASTTYATKASLTGTGYFKGAGAFPPSFSPTIPIADIVNTGGSTGDLLVGSGTTLVRLAVGAAGTVLKGGTVAWASIVNADIDAAAAIAGSKIAPDFVAQNITTTGAALVGATPRASIGTIRGPDGLGIYARNAGNTADQACFLSLTNILYVGGVSASNQHATCNVGATGTVNLYVNSTATVTATSTLLTSTQPIAIGTTVASTGSLRLPNAVDGVVFRNGANTANVTGLALNSSNQLLVGATGFASTRAGQVIIDGTTDVQVQTSGTTRLTINATVGVQIANGLPFVGGGTGAASTAIGQFRTGTTVTVVGARNAANSGDIAVLATDASNNVVMGADGSGGNRCSSAIMDSTSFSILRVGGVSKIFASPTTNTLINTTTDIQNASAVSVFKVNGAGVGFFNVTPVARAAAYTQTYSTASRTLPNPTSSDLTGISSSTTGSVLAEPSAAYTQAEMQQNFRRLQDQYNALRADHVALMQVVTSLIDDSQAYGLAQ